MILPYSKLVVFPLQGSLFESTMYLTPTELAVVNLHQICQENDVINMKQEI